MSILFYFKQIIPLLYRIVYYTLKGNYIHDRKYGHVLKTRICCINILLLTLARGLKISLISLSDCLLREASDYHWQLP